MNIGSTLCKTSSQHGHFEQNEEQEEEEEGKEEEEEEEKEEEWKYRGQYLVT